ncbi:serum response factor homolog isoform X2 [Bemisia tabaci]|uniref:serum response factor homolog isoform X2 n=1 Tax=Bemisia tabaci TaxID=7038 RepID=UPI003B2826B8
MDSPSSGGRDSRFSMGYNMSLLSGDTANEIYTSSVHTRPSTSITSGLPRSSLTNCGAGLNRGLKRTNSDLCFDSDPVSRSNIPNMTGDCGSDIVDESYSPSTQKGSPPSNGKKTKGRVKIKMEYIENKLRRYTTFSKRKTGIMKKAYELATLTGTQVMLLVASETGHVYTFATRKLQPMITSEAGKALIQTCLNSPDPCSSSGGDQRMSATGFEETELSYNIGDDEQKEDSVSLRSDSDDSSSSESPTPPSSHDDALAGGAGDETFAVSSSGLLYPTSQGMLYASPSNNSVLFSLDHRGLPTSSHYIRIPLPIVSSPSAYKPADLSSKSRK